MDQNSEPIEVLQFMSIPSILQEEQISKLKKQVKWLSRQALQLASFKIEYKQMRNYAESLEQKVKELRQENKQMVQKQKVFEQQFIDSSAKIAEIEGSQSNLRELTVQLQTQKLELIRDNQRLTTEFKNHTEVQQISVKYLSKICLRLGRQKYEDQITREDLVELIKNEKAENKLLRQGLISMSKDFKEFETKYQKKSKELGQLEQKYISLQEKNYELLKELEENDKKN